MRTTARRIGGGLALRKAMKDTGMTLQALHDRTVELDPDSKGVGRALIGFLTAPASAGTSGVRGRRSPRFRETTSPASADLIEQALGVRPGELFNREEVAEPGDIQVA